MSAVPTLVQKPVDPICDSFLRNAAPFFDKKKGKRLAEMRFFECPLHWFHPNTCDVGKQLVCTCVNSCDMAKMLGVSQSHLSRLETGKVEQSDFSLARMIAVFGEEKTAYILGNVNFKKFQRPRGPRARGLWGPKY